MSLNNCFTRGDINESITLFKYRDFSEEYHRKLLFDQELYFPSLQYLNDPFEGILPIQKISEISDEDIVKMKLQIEKYTHPDLSEESLNMLREHMESNVPSIRKRDENPNWKKDVQLEIKILLNKSFGILSLSSDPVNYLMWSHYANSHKGFCLGFNIVKLKSVLDMKLPLVVKYQKEMPIWRITEDKYKYAIKYLGTKGILWEYEQEVRFISRLHINNTLKFDIDLIDCVFLGGFMSDSDTEEIVQYLEKVHPTCRIYKIQFALNSYDLKGVRIN